MTAQAFKAGGSLLAFLLVCSSASAQQVLSADAPPDREGSGEVSGPITPQSPPAEPGHVSKRLFGVLPNHRADQFQPVYRPISTAEKFKIARSDSFDWPNYFLLAGYALQSEVASDGFQKSGSAAEFGRFYTRSLADQIIGSYVTEAILPSLLHEDPRFFRLGSGTFRHRVFYASSRILVTRQDNGHTVFNISEIGGNAAVTAIATLYYPDNRSAEEAAERYGLQLGNDLVSNLLTELWPDIKRHFHMRRHLPSP
jgi:hypothetical protein